MPILCGKNAVCNSDGSCMCNEGYVGNGFTGCTYDFCKDVSCDASSVCNPSNGKCECRDGYSLINGICTSPLCTNEPIIATENQYGYAMGHLESPFYGIQDYPTNFDCWYNVTAPRTEGILHLTYMILPIMFRIVLRNPYWASICLGNISIVQKWQTRNF